VSDDLDAVAGGQYEGFLTSEILLEGGQRFRQAVFREGEALPHLYRRCSVIQTNEYQLHPL
jgi:hypothetical protein